MTLGTLEFAQFHLEVADYLFGLDVFSPLQSVQVLPDLLDTALLVLQVTLQLLLETVAPSHVGIQESQVIHRGQVHHALPEDPCLLSQEEQGALGVLGVDELVNHLDPHEQPLFHLSRVLGRRLVQQVVEAEVNEYLQVCLVSLVRTVLLLLHFLL